MTPDLDAMMAAARAATPGEWRTFNEDDCRVVVDALDDQIATTVVRGRPTMQTCRDAAHIAAWHPTAALAAAAELQELRAANQRLRDAAGPLVREPALPPGWRACAWVNLGQHATVKSLVGGKFSFWTKDANGERDTLAEAIAAVTKARSDDP